MRWGNVLTSGGHPAIAITDHGGGAGFPGGKPLLDAWGGCVPKDSDLRCFYGMEAYLVDDLKGMVTNPKTVPGRQIRGFRH